jgi:hypothetical protein
MTVQQLIDALSKVDDKFREVKVWLPGERISLTAILLHTIQIGDGAIMIEGSFDPAEIKTSR